ncbi:hypothetical protein AAur_2690 [Paenarthrobacter aurescens TC1]|uniref:Uncharacterized protein n=1 Tax=Paenarthrobacter aurescens (strain TC1) TaxID=290340 RepID=A1R843_PAEAT|nr:hypothetical protein AAur_2690 [Paenarthrobacter aurescens TC1]
MDPGLIVRDPPFRMPSKQFVPLELSNFQGGNLPNSIQTLQPHGYGTASLLFGHYDACLAD